MKDGTPPNSSSQTSSHTEVAICFHAEALNEIFAALLETRGYQTKILQAIEGLPAGTRLITEPRFIASIENQSLQNCLVVGNSSSEIPACAHGLARPLTEEKVEDALNRFLEN